MFISIFLIDFYRLMKLYWLEEYLTHYGDIFAVNINRQSDKRYKKLIINI